MFKFNTFIIAYLVLKFKKILFLYEEYFLKLQVLVLRLQRFSTASIKSFS